MGRTSLHWVEGPWRGKLAMSARPRGNDWLSEEISEWKSAGVETVLSLLEPSEERDLELVQEGDEVRAQAMNFLSFPIPDREVPESDSAFAGLLSELETELSAGKNIVLHCRQGVGRTGLVAAGLFIAQGFAPSEALERLSAARGVSLPETEAQRLWLLQFAASFAPTR